MAHHDKTPVSLSRALHSGSSALSVLSRRARALQRWEQVIGDQLPAEFRGHWALARVDTHGMVLVADSPAWASRLRYMGSQIMRLVANAGGPAAVRMTIKVGNPAPQPKKATPRQLSEQARRCILSAAEAQQDPKLRAALFRLGRRG